MLDMAKRDGTRMRVAISIVSRMHMMLAGHAFRSDGTHLTPAGVAFFLDAVRPLLEAVAPFHKRSCKCCWVCFMKKG